MEHREYRKLHAEWYDLVSSREDHSREIEFWVQCIRASSQPILELGSGTGRVYVPLLEQGLDISGIDTSGDMMDRCRAKCKAKGLRADLYKQSMLEFDLSRTFGLVILPSGGLGLLTSDKDIYAMFRRVMSHLKRGGLFVFEFEPLPTEKRSNVDDTRWTGDWVTGPDDTVIAWRTRRKCDPTSHIWESLFVVEKFAHGCLVAAEANERTGRFFSVEQAVSYAEAVGFEEIRATNWLTEEPPTKNARVVTVRCRKPSADATV